MAIVDDDMKEDSLWSIFLNSRISNVDEETLTPEVVAWADSCLNKDADADWSSIKDALLEILSSQQEPPTNSSSVQSSIQQLAADDVLHFREDLTSMELGSVSDENEDLIYNDVGEIESIDVSEDDEDDLIFRNKWDQKKGKVRNVFRPNYSEDVKVENLDSDLNSSSKTSEVYPSSVDIFKVWDLGVSEDQDDFAKLLNKALDDNIPAQIQSSTSDSAALIDPMHVSMDDLIAGIGDLSLKQNTT
ncbi:hypothetical protein SOVF_190590 [Spinacia oleracea]|uniref:Uncharacterized protein n=1 Tax=Spinacia oleracea TaxID=3562 RepID=A0A9R0JLI3_SPIOL|nr:uncharacterized protein LOC110778466 [Spinacia oleracea]KNA05414.1 hypothetical protein SOVF_190590 [Spinacia oleracea]